jgi:hypothetical protein
VRSFSFALVGGLGAVLGLAGCQSSAPDGRTASDSVPVLTAGAASAAGLSAEEAAAANQLYVAKCAKCHKFYNPAGYSPKDWERWMRKMSRKSKLKPDQDELLTRYLGAFREGYPAPAKQ